MERVEAAIETAYEGHVIALYKNLAESIASANGNETDIVNAEDRFRRGLRLAADVRARARGLAGL